MQEYSRSLFKKFRQDDSEGDIILLDGINRINEIVLHEALAHVGNGLSNRQIARKLFISENTVKVHVRGIFNKLDIKNRQQAAVYASQEGLITSPEPKNSEESTH